MDSSSVLAKAVCAGDMQHVPSYLTGATIGSFVGEGSLCCLFPAVYSLLPSVYGHFLLFCSHVDTDNKRYHAWNLQSPPLFSISFSLPVSISPSPPPTPSPPVYLIILCLLACTGGVLVQKLGYIPPAAKAAAAAVVVAAKSA
jgi:hypothetical protein